MEGCSKRSAGAAPGLPDDPLVEILSRVPAKSVCRFKCVSKAWRDLITDPHHRKKLRQPMQGLFVQTSKESEADDVESEAADDESELNDVESEADDDELVRIRMSFNFINLTGGSVPLDIESCFSFLKEMTGIEAFLLDSCNGLILFGQRLEQSHLFDGYIVCNPTTRQWSAVPHCESPVSYGCTYLAFDPAVSSHFHLVLFQTDFFKNIVLLHVYSSETGAWSQNQIYETKEQGQLEVWHHLTLDEVDHCTFVNGFLHLVVFGSDAKCILAVDIQGKAKRMITLPSMADGRQEYDDIITYHLGQSQGHLHCVILESWNEKISTWVLQDYDTQEWVLKKTVRALDVFGRRREVTVFDVVDIHEDCNVVFFFHHWGCELIAYNMDSKEVNVLATFKKTMYRSEFARYIPYFSESLALTNKY